MFLVTTALEEYWDKGQKILFLGEWCRRYSRREEWKKLDYEVLPYHWDDRKRLSKDYFLLDSLYEKYLSCLSDSLSAIHGRSRSSRYWRIIIGPWLYTFIQVLYDRYTSIKEAVDSGKVTGTRICPNPDTKWVPQDLSSFFDWLFSDHYNLYLYSSILTSIDGLRYETRGDQHPGNRSKGVQNRRSVKERIIDEYGKRIPPCLNRDVFVLSHLHILDLLRLQVRLGQLPYPCGPAVTLPKASVDQQMRKSVILPENQDPFESLLASLIPHQIPTVYIEGFRAAEKAALQAFPKKPALIFTANGHYTDEAFKFWAADQVEQGIPFVTSQHGGLHGTGLLSTNEVHEIAISDRCFTWGWETEGEEKFIPLPSPKLLRESLGVRPSPRGDILWVACSGPRYSYNLLSMVMGPQMELHLREQERFFAALQPEARRLLLLRLYMYDYGWDEEERWANTDPGLRSYRGPIPLSTQLNQSRLFIGTYNATTFLQAFAANFPSVLFWNPDHWELRPAAQPYFDGLRRVGILHDTPESAANLVNRIYADPMAWWWEPRIQEAKNTFCQRFARTSKTWLHEWVDCLKSLS